MQALSRPKKRLPKQELVATSSITIVVSTAFGIAYGTGALTLAAGLLPFCLVIVEICGVALGAPLAIMGLMQLKERPVIAVRKIAIGLFFVYLGIFAPQFGFASPWAPLPMDINVPYYSISPA